MIWFKRKKELRLVGMKAEKTELGKRFKKGQTRTPEQEAKRSATVKELVKKGLWRTSWKGGRVMRGEYIGVWAPDNPLADKTGYALEHRIIAEKLLGRALKRTEIVHHKNEVKSDNRKRNLMVLKNKGAHIRMHISKLLEGDVLWPIS